MDPKAVRFVLSVGENYSHLPDAEDTECLLSGGSTGLEIPKGRNGPSKVSILLTVAIVVSSCLVSTLCGIWIGRRYPSDDGAIRHVSKYSPIMDEVDIGFHAEQFNGTFVHENIYRQGPGPEVDAAWDALGIRCELLTFSGLQS